MRSKYLLLLPLFLISFVFVSAIDISTCQELQDMNLSSNDNYVLVNDIDCSDTINWNEGAGFNPIGNDEEGFEGTLDGQGYTISNLYINRDVGNVGLFGILIFDPIISNVHLVNVNITGLSFVGGLVGYMGSGNITGCSVSGTVIGGDYTGGLIGYSSTVYQQGTDFNSIDKCYSTANVNGNNYVGGLVGRSVDAGITDYDVMIITNSYATGDVVGNNYVGGLVGFALGHPIDKCYSTGSVSGILKYKGGLVSVGLTITNSFWDIETSGRLTSSGGTGKTTEEMKNITTFSDAGWIINELEGENDYPFLVDNSWIMYQVNEEQPQGGILKLWQFDELENETTETSPITGDVIDGTTKSQFSLSTWFQNIWTWIKGLFN